MCTYTRMHSEGLRHTLNSFFPYLLYLKSFFFFFPFSTAPLMDAFQSGFVSDITNFFIYIDMRALQNCCLVGSVYDEPVRNDG